MLAIFDWFLFMEVVKMASPEKLSYSEMFQSADELYGRIVSKAAEDAEFRSALLEDPKSVISSEFDVHLPDSFDITVHESKGTTLHLALPSKFDQLNDEDLEAVVGGTHYPFHNSV